MLPFLTFSIPNGSWCISRGDRDHAVTGVQHRHGTVEKRFCPEDPDRQTMTAVKQMIQIIDFPAAIAAFKGQPLVQQQRKYLPVQACFLPDDRKSVLQSGGFIRCMQKISRLSVNTLQQMSLRRVSQRTASIRSTGDCSGPGAKSGFRIFGMSVWVQYRVTGHKNRILPEDIVRLIKRVCIIVHF